MPRYLSLETEPFGKWKGVPIYLTTIIVAVMVAALILCAFIQADGRFNLGYAAFGVPRDGWANAITLFIYPLVGGFDFFTPFTIFFFYQFSVGIETHLGRRVLTKLLILLVVTPAAVITLLAYGLGMPSSIIGSFFLAAGMVVAFSTLYPNAMAFGYIPFKYVAPACVFCASFMQVAEKNYFGLAALWVTCLAAMFYILHALDRDYDDYVPITARIRGMFRRKPKFHVVRQPQPLRKYRSEYEDESPEPESGVTAEVDAILEKVARSGLNSLSPAEHAKLQKAREELQRRDNR